MGLNKYCLGDLLELLENNNADLQFDASYVRGVNNLKKLMPTKVDISDRDLSKFQIVRRGEFVFNHRTSRNSSKFSIAYNDGAAPIICTEDYVVFRVRPDCTSILMAEWLYVYFNRPEFDRYVITNSWGSSTEFYNWEDICSITLDLPDLPTQKKYVAIYKAMQANQQSYERGLEDLKLVCEGHFDVAKKQQTMSLGSLIESVDLRNTGSEYSQIDVKGITNSKEFSETRADVSSVDLRKFKIVHPGQFAYNSRTDGRDMLVLALNRENKPVIVTFNYNTFRVRPEMSNIIDTDYLYAFFRRSEFDRRVRFSSWGSSQELLSWDNLCNIQVPVPDNKMQRTIAAIMNVYLDRAKINERLKALIKDICPILIRGSLSDGG